MTMRSIGKTITFRLPFALKGAEQIFPAGAYRVVTDEELIEGISLSRLSPDFHGDIGARRDAWRIGRDDVG